MSILDRRTVITAVATGVLWPGFAVARQRDASQAATGPDPRDALLDRASETAGGPPAMAAAVVTRQGLVWSGVRGVRQSGLDDMGGMANKAGPQDRWHLGSNTKAMTAAVWARLVEQGRARWDMPLSEAFPGSMLDPALSVLTIEDLLRHKAGLMDRDVLPLPMVAHADPRPVGQQRAALGISALNRAPTGTVGQFAYANINYVLVGAAIEQITGQSWEDAIKTELFVPLNLTSAGFGAPLTSTDGGANAWGHQVSGETRTPIDPTSPYADNPPMLGPAGRVHMTLADYGRFLQAMMSGGPATWLTADSLDRLTTALPGDRYGLGWLIQPDGTIAHEGSNTLWHVITVLNPTEGRAVVVASNGGMAGRQVTAPLALGLM